MLVGSYVNVASCKSIHCESIRLYLALSNEVPFPSQFPSSPVPAIVDTVLLTRRRFLII
jgi:hypothetical protein